MPIVIPRDERPLYSFISSLWAEGWTGLRYKVINGRACLVGNPPSEVTA